MQIVKKLSKLLAIGIILSFLFPVIKVGSIGFKPDLIFIIFTLPVLFFDQKIVSFSIIRKYKLILFLLIISLIISTIIGNMYYNTRASLFPTEYYQIFSRLTVFTFFLGIGYYQIISTNNFVKLVSIVFILGLLFGVLQSINIPIVKSLSLNYYAITDQQVKGFSSLNFRGFGTSGNILTWGGLSLLTFYFYYFLVSNKFIRVIGLVLSVYNVLLTASRSALFALVISFVFIYFYDTVIIKGKMSVFIRKMLLIVLVLIISVMVFSFIDPDRIELLTLRILKSEEDLTESSRGAQISTVINFISSDYWNIIFGIGKDKLNELGFMEVEFIFLIAAYGLIGSILHYASIYVLFSQVRKVQIYNRHHFFLISLIVSMIVFSLGYFFFREAYSGVVFWWLTGFILGVYIRDSKV